jgi:Cu-Zn family superoxide dismutase
MKLLAWPLLGALAATCAACTTVGDLPNERIASARLMLANGIPAGTVQLLGTGDRLTLAVAVTGIAEGPHGFHLHTTGKCTAPDFKSAGGHLNPGGHEHGTLNPQGSHLGDLPNLVVGSSKTASTTVELDGDRAEILGALFDEDGTAVVIHEGADDYRSDPAGDAGSRIACGVLTRL